MKVNPFSHVSIQHVHEKFNVEIFGIPLYKTSMHHGIQNIK